MPSHIDIQVRLYSDKYTHSETHRHLNSHLLCLDNEKNKVYPVKHVLKMIFREYRIVIKHLCFDNRNDNNRSFVMNETCVTKMTLFS